MKALERMGTDTITGIPLLTRMLGRSAVGGVVLASIFTVLLFVVGSERKELWQHFVFAFWFVVGFVFFGLLIQAICDYFGKLALLTELGVRVRVGVDSFQQRRFIVSAPSALLEAALRAAVEQGCGDGAIVGASENAFEYRTRPAWTRSPVRIWVRSRPLADEWEISIRAAPDKWVPYPRDLVFDQGQAIRMITIMARELKKRLSCREVPWPRSS